MHLKLSILPEWPPASHTFSDQGGIILKRQDGRGKTKPTKHKYSARSSFCTIVFHVIETPRRACSHSSQWVNTLDFKVFTNKFIDLFQLQLQCLTFKTTEHHLRPCIIVQFNSQTIPSQYTEELINAALGTAFTCTQNYFHTHLWSKV